MINPMYLPPMERYLLAKKAALGENFELWEVALLLLTAAGWILGLTMLIVYFCGTAEFTKKHDNLERAKLGFIWGCGGWIAGFFAHAAIFGGSMGYWLYTTLPEELVYAAERWTMFLAPQVLAYLLDGSSF